MFFSSKKVIGIDLGSSSVKLVELEASGNRFNLISFGAVPTPPEAISNGQINDTGLLAGAIQSILSQTKTKTKVVVSGMWGSSIVVRKITIPRVNEKVLPETIRFEAEPNIPFEIASCALSYEVLNSNQSPDTMDVLIVAAKNDQLVQYVEAISLCQLKCKIMDSNSIALANCFELNYGIFHGESIALLNFGSEVTNLVVIQNGELIFCRDIGVGGQSISMEISKALGISMQDADSLKISGIAGNEVPEEVHGIINSESERIVEEIKNIFEFFYASNPGIQFSRCFFSGGSANIKSLVQQVSIALGVNFERMDPFKNINVNNKKFNLAYLEKISYLAPIAIGLASREANKL